MTKRSTVLVINNNPDCLPGRYTPMLIARIQEAGMSPHEVRTVDSIDAVASDTSRNVELIVSCGSPVVLTEPVDIRAHVSKTTAAMLHFPDAPVVGICYGMQLIALLYGGKLLEQRETRHAGLWAVLERLEHVPSQLLSSVAGSFQQWASNFIFVEQVPWQFVTTAVDSLGRAMAMEHVSEHVYGIQWHPEVLAEDLGRQIIDKILALAGQKRQAKQPCLARGPKIATETSREVSRRSAVGQQEAEKRIALRESVKGPTAHSEVSWHTADLELRKVVKELVSSSRNRAVAAELGKVLAGARKDALAALRLEMQSPGTVPGRALEVAVKRLHEAASKCLPAPAG